MRQTIRGIGSRWAACAAEGALSALLFAAALWYPPFGFLSCIASPLPLALAAWRRGAWGALAAVAVGAALAAGAAGPLGAVTYVAQFGLGGCLLGLAARSGLPPAAVVGAYAGATTAGFWVLLGGLALRSGVSPVAVMGDTVTQAASQAREFLLRADPSAEATAAAQQWAEQTTRLFLRGFPGIVAALNVILGWANALGMRRILAGRGVTLTAWNTWRTGEHWIWLLIGSGLATLLARGSVATVAANVFIPMLAVYFLQGMAIVQHLFETKQFPRPVRVVTYVLLVLQLPVMLVVAGVGAFDLWVDFRSRWSPPPPTKNAET